MPENNYKEFVDQPSGTGLPEPQAPPVVGWKTRLNSWWSRVAHAVLFTLTLLTTFSIGLGTVASFNTLVSNDPALELAGFWAWLTDPGLLWSALVYTVALLGFLTAHEMGHYLMCRRYGLRATLPYYLPNPIIFGTFGAVIKIKSPIRNKKSLFDIGIAGPIAGFIIAIPVLFIGLDQSLLINVSDMSAISGGSDSLIVLGEPLMHKFFVWLLYPVEGNYTLIMSPLGMVGWFACLVTSINLLPVSQLDGGHILYAVFGKAHFQISLLVVLTMAGLALYTEYWGWLFWIALIILFKLRHPPLLNERIQLGWKRRLISLLALLIFILCFMPVPIDVSM